MCFLQLFFLLYKHFKINGLNVLTFTCSLSLVWKREKRKAVSLNQFSVTISAMQNQGQCFINKCYFCDLYYSFSKCSRMRAARCHLRHYCFFPQTQSYYQPARVRQVSSTSLLDALPSHPLPDTYSQHVRFTCRVRHFYMLVLSPSHPNPAPVFINGYIEYTNRGIRGKYHTGRTHGAG